MKTLHVLNGDATARPFADAGLPGDVAVWREMLSEGPLLASPKSDDELWTLRQNWLTEQFDDRTNADSYAETVVAEFARICQYADYAEVVFWFEHDLCCQINLVFLLACFARVELGQTVLKQVSINGFAGVENFKGLGQLTGQQLAVLYPQADPLTVNELMLSVRVWPAYADADIAALTALLTDDFGRLRFLRAALVAHLARLQPGINGLSLIDNQLLDLIRAAPKSPRQAVEDWLASDRIYGLGDWSIENHLAQLIQRRFIAESAGVLVEVAH